MTYNFDSVALEHEYPATACGIPDGDGLLVAYLPRLDGVMQEVPDRVRDLTLYAMDGILVDAIAADARKVKWWLIRNAAFATKLGQVQPIWQGPAGEFKLSCLPEVPRPSPEARLYMRAYSHGPWIRLEKKDDAGVGDPDAISDSSGIHEQD